MQSVAEWKANKATAGIVPVNTGTGMQSVADWKASRPAVALAPVASIAPPVSGIFTRAADFFGSLSLPEMPKVKSLAPSPYFTQPATDPLSVAWGKIGASLTNPPNIPQTPLIQPGTPLASLAEKARAAKAEVDAKIASYTKPIAEGITALGKGVAQAISPTVDSTGYERENRNFRDIANMIPAIIQSSGIPNGILSIAEAIKGGSIGELRYPAFNDAQIVASGVQTNYDKRVLEGQTPSQAFWGSALELGIDFAILVPLARSITALGVAKFNPEALLQKITFETQGAREFMQTGKPMPKELQDAFVSLPTETKVKVLKGLVTQVTQPTPSRLGKILGISEQEAKALFNKMNAPAVPLQLKQGDKIPTVAEWKEAVKTVEIVSKPEAPVVVPKAVKVVPKVGEVVKMSNTLYHGTSAENAKLILSDALHPTSDETATYGTGVYLTRDRNVAEGYTTELKDGKVLEVNPKQDLNLYTPTLEERKHLIDLIGAEQQDAVASLLGDKYDGLNLPVIKGMEGDGSPQIVIYDKQGMTPKENQYASQKLNVKNPSIPGTKTLTIKPSTPTAKEKELAKGVRAPGVATIKGKAVPTPTQRVSKTELKALIKTLPGQKAEFTVIDKNGEKRMQFTTPNGSMSMRPSALGLVEDNINIGDKIVISAEDLKATGAALRGIDEEGNVSAMPRGLSASKGSSPIDKFEDRIGEPVKETPPEDFKLYEKVNELIRKYAERVGEGYLPRGAAGAFYHDTHTIRLVGMNNLSVAAHEITHRLDLVNNISVQLMKVTGTAKNGNPIYDRRTAPLRKELTQLYIEHYPGGRAEHKLKTRMVEGYATLLQKYVEAPVTTEQNYPTIVTEMLKSGGEFYQPVIGEIIIDLGKIIEDYQGLGALDKVGARVTSDINPTGKESFLNGEEYITSVLADEVFPHEKIAIEAGVSMTTKDPSLPMRRYKGLGTVFAKNNKPGDGYWAFNKEQGAFVKIYDKNWGDLQRGLEKKQLFDEFGHYLVARDQHFLFEELPKLREDVLRLKKEVENVGVSRAKMLKNDDGMTLYDEYQSAKEGYIALRDQLANNGFSQKVVAEAYVKNKELFADETAQHDLLAFEDIKLWHSVGRIPDKRFALLSSKEGHASLKRQFYDEIAGDEKVEGSGGTPRKGISALKQRTGSSRVIIHPVLNAIKNHAEITRKAMRQHIENLMSEVANSGKLPDVFQKIQVQRTVDKNTGAITYPQEKDPQVLMGFLDGNPNRRVAFEMDSYLKNSMNSILDYQNIEFFGKLMLGANRLFVKGTTGVFPGFTLTNISMDQVTMLSQTQQNLVPIYSPLAALYKAVSNKRGVVYERLQEYLANGGEMHTIVGWQNLSATELVQKVTHEREGLFKFLDWMDQGLDILAFPQKWSEIASRFAEYNAAREVGDTIIVASEKAANVTVSFHKMGSLGGRNMQTFIKSIPFFNPGIQALYTMYRAGFKRGPAARNRLLFVLLGLFAAQAAAFGLLNSRGTQKQKDAFADLTPEEMGGYIWYPKPDGETLGKQRLPNNLNVFGTLLNMALADNYWGTKYSNNDYKAASTGFLPAQTNVFKPAEMVFSWIPQGLKVPIEYFGNVKDFPSVRQIESDSQLRKEPGQRVTPATSAVAAWMGREFNISPVKLDFLVTGIFGRASGFIMNKPGVYNPLSVLSKDYYFEGGRNVQKFYDQKKVNDQQYNTLKNNPQSMDIKERAEVMKQRVILNRIGDLLTLYGKIDETKDKLQVEKLRKQILILTNKL